MQLNRLETGRDIEPTPNADAAAAGRLSPGGALFAAALALPGVAGTAQAETPPDRARIDVNYQDYHDWQPGFDRITVHSPSLRLLLPVAGAWALDAALVSDSISGATPRYHSAISGASTMNDHRRAEDLTVTRYFSRGTVTAGFAHSGENDYQSRAYSIAGTLSTEDKNTTGNFGVAVSNDVINPVNGAVSDAKKHVFEIKGGITQVLTQRDIVQLDLSHVRQHGYLDDPYKIFDMRPGSRDANIVLLRWNHHIERTAGTSRAGYRYYADTYGIRSHTLSLDYVQPLPHGWTATPSLRAYSQSAADFYFGPVYSPLLGPPVPAGYSFAPGSPISEDYRLSAFGALTLGAKLEKEVTRDLRISVQAAAYEQRSSWAWSGRSGPDLAPLRARIINVGLSKLF